jgi:hypothetical protein
MFVQGLTPPDGISDLTKTLDISATGAEALAIRTNQVVNLTIPAPRLLRDAAVRNSHQARVRRHHAADGIYLLGVEFLKALE